jgi:hypothetical protein
VPPNAPTPITVSARDAEGLRAESRLAQFIRYLQEGRRLKAVQLMSSRVPPQARQALVTKKWLPTRPTSRADFGQVFFWKDLHIRTWSIRRATRQLVVAPRRIRFDPGNRKKPPTGWLEVTMRKERGEWWVEILPPPTLQLTRQAPPAPGA